MQWLFSEICFSDSTSIWIFTQIRWVSSQIDWSKASGEILMISLDSLLLSVKKFHWYQKNPSPTPSCHFQQSISSSVERFRNWLVSLMIFVSGIVFLETWDFKIFLKLFRLGYSSSREISSEFSIGIWTLV